jgi:hypothetical protein
MALADEAYLEHIALDVVDSTIHANETIAPLTGYAYLVEAAYALRFQRDGMRL